MSILPVCDICHQPKESTRHYALTRQWRDSDEVEQKTRYSGTIDLCDDCRERVSHDGRAGHHKKAYNKRIEFGKVTR